MLGLLGDDDDVIGENVPLPNVGREQARDAPRQKVVVCVEYADIGRLGPVQRDVARSRRSTILRKRNHGKPTTPVVSQERLAARVVGRRVVDDDHLGNMFLLESGPYGPPYRVLRVPGRNNDGNAVVFRDHCGSVRRHRQLLWPMTIVR